MKKRIKIDSSILSFVIILTGILYQFRHLYGENLFVDDILDFVGLLTVLSGTFLRMTARGFKKAHSNKGQGLVKDGPYTVTRNPMYLGSFLMGAGFVLIVWPWWSLFIFVVLFYFRFNKQMMKEEEYLDKVFGQTYKNYAIKTPRIFPSISSLRRVKFKKTFPLKTGWDTKEKWGLFGWPLVAVLLEIIQEKIVFDVLDIGNTVKVFALSIAVFACVTWVLYRDAKDSK